MYEALRILCTCAIQLYSFSIVFGFVLYCWERNKGSRVLSGNRPTNPVNQFNPISSVTKTYTVSHDLKPIIDKTDLSKFTVRQLKKWACIIGYIGYSSWRKDTLMDSINKFSGDYISADEDSQKKILLIQLDILLLNGYEFRNAMDWISDKYKLSDTQSSKLVKFYNWVNKSTN
jgi:hypothetical protein